MKLKYIIRKRQLGDVLWIEPLIREMSLKYKKLVVCSKFNVLFENYPANNVLFKNELSFIEKVWCRVEKWLGVSFLFVNLEGAYEKEPGIHFLHAYQKRAGLKCTYEYPRLYLTEEEKKNAIVKAPKYVVLHIESFSDRNYRKVYGINWEEICEGLKKQGYEVIQVGKSPEAIKGTTTVNTSIRELITVIYHCQFFIGIDSGPSHIAAALQKPSLIFFGAINPEYRHFKHIFKGYFLQQYCEFAGCYHTPGLKEDPYCKLVANSEIPKCSLHSNKYVAEKIDLLIKNFIENGVGEN